MPRLSPLGDSHNFGRRVELREDRVKKPRTLFWEWLLLSAKSPLRQLFAQVDDNVFGFLPTLRFWRHGAPSGGEVERVLLRPLRVRTAERQTELAAVLGRALALFSWLGVSDLHWENLVLGLNERGQIVFGPLDVEIMLTDLRSPVETRLLPAFDPDYADLYRHAAGVRRALPFLGKPIGGRQLAAMVDAYRATLAWLEGSGGNIGRTLAGLSELRRTPIRVCLRSTGDYVQTPPDQLWPPLLDAEREQLARGDIPYFFRLYGTPGIHYFRNRALTQIATLPLRGDVPKNQPLLDVGKGLRSAAHRRLRDEGMFAIVAAFDDPALTGQHESDGLTLALDKRRIRIGLPGGEELETSRKLAAVVGSVYLPCGCGEVKTVLVPPVTVCRSVNRGV